MVDVILRHVSPSHRLGVLALPPRVLLGIVVAAALIAGLSVTGSDATAQAAAAAGADLTRLLRAMAVIKGLMAAAAAAALFWRLGLAVAAARLSAYLLSMAAATAGPGLIWSMAHVGSGALLLHGGLLSLVILLWRDPAVAERLAEMAAARRPRK